MTSLSYGKMPISLHPLFILICCISPQLLYAIVISTILN
ncbi:hypothetical protein FM106_22650 [Brachybacterium faecium]|nr:hypothetical protein FM106_22650 [Brachybacterium faecium]